MRSLAFLALAALLATGCASTRTGSAKVLKVLPHFLDREGRHSVSPSLYDRDAYQARLRRHPEERSGLRFDVEWKSYTAARFRLRVELRGARGQEPTTAALEVSAQHVGGLSAWSALQLDGADYEKFGELVAWRVSLWDGDGLVGEKKSFLW